MVDYHNARVYVLDDDGQTLEPVAFRGSIDEYAGETLEALRVAVGEGITGTAAERGKTLNIPDANACPFAAQIPGTDDIDESILAVPFMYDRHATGVLVLAKLGLNQFSALAVRQVELLAAHAAVALENARLLAEERRAAATAEVLLDIATAASREASPQVVARRVTAAACRLAGAAGAALVVERGGRHRVLAAHGDRSVRSVGLAVARGRDAADPGVSVIALGDLPALPVSADAPRLAAHVGVHGGALVVVGDRFGTAACETVAAIAGQGSLALQNAALLRRLREGYSSSLRRSS
jgi:putative methionine-R-sulfoxide reductase with GAF domain